MNRRLFLRGMIIAVLVVAAAGLSYFAIRNTTSPQSEFAKLRVGIAPYQDMAMLVNAKPIGLEKKYHLNLDLVVVPWESLTPAVASAGNTVDVAFASLLQFIAQEAKINAGSTDPVVFFYPAYVFKGGAFVSFDASVPIIDASSLDDVEKLRKFLSYSFAAQNTSSYQMLLFDLAKRANIPFGQVKIVDMDSGDGLLAAVNGAVSVAAAGLTQKNEAKARGGRIVLEMEALGQVDIAGFIARRSTIDSRRADLENFIRIWLAGNDYVLSDIGAHSGATIDWLNKTSSTHYTVEQFKDALSQEILPRSVAEVRSEILTPQSTYYWKRIFDVTAAYYLGNRLIAKPPQNVEMIELPN